jgi:hypothetical protein
MVHFRFEVLVKQFWLILINIKDNYNITLLIYLVKYLNIGELIA